MKPQVLLKAMGSSGCYFLALIYDADMPYSLLDLAEDLIKKGYMRQDMFIINPVQVYNSVHRKHVSRVLLSETFDPHAMVAVKNVGGHFVRVDSTGVVYDSYEGYTDTSAVGTYRLFYG